MMGVRNAAKASALWLVIGLGLAGAALITFRSPVTLHADRLALTTAFDQVGNLLSPLIFIAIQALQVVIAPIPGDFTGLVGGFVFGQWRGFFYSTLGLTIGSLVAFGVGRRFGTRLAQCVMTKRVYDQIGVVSNAHGPLLGFIVFFVPGLPKDLACYVFGIGRMPVWTFVAVSTLGRLPGTWLLSAQGAHAAAGEWIEFVALLAGVIVLGVSLHRRRSRILRWATQSGEDRWRGRCRDERGGASG
jgi:uncharacterized membrane protein YdjX (TVP38/TMEM64 family)